MENDRGRAMSHGGQHISPIPSPHNYRDTITGLDSSIDPLSFATGSFNPSQSHEISFNSQADRSFNSQPDQSFNSQSDQQYTSQPEQYINNYMPQMDNSYIQSLDSNMNQNYNNQYQYGGDLQTIDMNQFNVNPADLKISSPEHASPRLLSPEIHSSAPQSPSPSNPQFYTPQHSRNASLDPNSAYQDWQGMAFRQHQRSPSDVSDRSSVQNSPYLPNVDIEGSHSPLFDAQDNLGLDQGFDQFTIADQASQPGSAYVSPRLMPQQEGLGIGSDIMLNPGYQQQSDRYQSMSLHNRNHSVVSDIGQADQFAPPTINIEPAPVSRQASFGPSGQEPDGLSPPPPNMRGRNRSQSDVTFTRPMTSRDVSPGPQSNIDSLSVRRSPSPGPSRSPSPGVSDGRISKDRRASTSAINSNNREYILDLADPTRPNGSTGNSTRVQKHPATFQCTLCPKRFTRAYNLRSHLRTHTDERPFVCTVCSKAFARQHDRKRHEGLHSGEKKFICKGELTHSPGQTWGCGRRFARADALGRHFRSEAGRVCIKPLLDEEAAERRNKMMMEHAQQVHMLQPVPQPMMVPDMNAGFALPAALLAQYPALQNIDWSALQQQGDDGDLSDIGVGPFDDALSDGGSYGHNAQWV